MSIKQISIFIENRPGALEDFTRVLADGGIDLIALSLADTTDFGILRAIVNDHEKTLALVKEKGYTAKQNDVLAVAVPDSPGGLAGALAVLREGGLSIEYLYSFVRQLNQQAIIIFRADKPELAETRLKAAGYHLIEQDEVACTLAGDC